MRDLNFVFFLFSVSFAFLFNYDSLKLCKYLIRRYLSELSPVLLFTLEFPSEAGVFLYETQVWRQEIVGLFVAVRRGFVNFF